jgi:hypothetical protein
MTQAQAKKLAAKLDLSVGENILVDVTDDAIVFTSWWTGQHTLDIATSTTARVKAHWAGFLANQPETV